MADSPQSSEPLAESPDAGPTPADVVVSKPRRRGFLGRLADRARASGERVVYAAVDRLLQPREPNSPPPAAGENTATPPVESPAEARRRLGLMHNVTLRLRGAADEYIAAKLDEIEARVDVKLDEVEKRIDQKIADLHEQVRRMRDDELRHRLRILKITLIFTVLVAVMSLGYKLLIRSFSP